MDSIKTVIRSLLTSNPTTMTINDLSREYKNTMGENVPFQRFGFNSLEHFLRSVPDTVQLRGNGPHAQIILVFSEKSAHVAQLVSKQKITKKKRAPMQRRTIIAPPPDSMKTYMTAARVESKKIVYPPVKSSVPVQINVKPNNYQCENTNLHSTSTTPTSERSSPEMSNTEQYKSNIRHSVSTDTVDRQSVNTDECKNNVDKSLNTVRSQLQNFTLSQNNLNPIKRINNSISSNNSRVISPQQHQYDDDDRSKPTLNTDELFSTSEGETSVPVMVRNNLKTLIKKYPDGVWCTELSDIYRKMFKRELKFVELGFRNLIDLCKCLKSIFHWVRPGHDDFKLYDKSRPLPNSAEKEFTVASYSSPVLKTANNSLDNALPQLDWRDVSSFLPPNILQPGDEIPRCFVPTTTVESDTIEVVMGEVFDVSKFWVYRDDNRLDDLMNKMQDFYKECAEKYLVPKELIRKGLYCASVIFGEYHRVLVADVTSEVENSVLVFYIDYGTVRRECGKLYFLHKSFAKLPAQTLRCKLTGIFPIIQGAPWSRECTEEFKRIVKGRDLLIKIARIDWNNEVLEVFLADVTDSNNIFYINNRLIESGFAVSANHTDLVHRCVRNLHR